MYHLVKQLELHHLDGSLEEGKQYNGFQDDDLKMFPAAEIVELNLSALECETIANNIMQALARADQQTIREPARALVALAYNSLMDPYYGRRKLTLWDNPKPLFHSDRYKYHEDWLRVIARSELDLRDYLIPTDHSQFDEMKLWPLNRRASDFERKASIGAWAFFHLRLMGNLRARLWSPCKVERFRQAIRQQYGFDSAYQFPLLSHSGYVLLQEHFMNDRSGELWFLFYRSIIALENMPRQYFAQRKLLEELVFDENPSGLKESGLWLWTYSKWAADSLKIRVEKLIDELVTILRDPTWSKYAYRTSKNLKHLRKFFEIHIRPGNSGTSSRYYKYARVVNHWYFHSLNTTGNKEIIQALIYIIEQKTGQQVFMKPTGEPWSSWGILMGKRIHKKYSNNIGRQYDNWRQGADL